MTLGIATAVRSAEAAAILAAIDAAVGAGKLRIYDGSRPATGGTVTNLLAELPFSNPAGSVTNGVLTLDPITDDSAADADGTATWFRILDGDDTFVLDGSAGESGTDIILGGATIVEGGTVAITSAVFTVGNA